MMGAIRAFYGIQDGYVVLHSPPGCHSGAMLMNCMSDNTTMRIALSGLHTRDLVFGAEERALITLKKLDSTVHPKFMVLMDCCASGIIGEDLPSMVEMAKNEGVQAALMYFKGIGFHGLMWQGYEDALTGLLEHMRPQKKTIENSINLIGFLVDEPRSTADLREIKRICSANGIHINSVLTSGNFSEIINAPAAALNVVLDGDGLFLAKAMMDHFQIPYITVQYPYGFAGTNEFLTKISARLEVKLNTVFLQTEQRLIEKTLEKVKFYLWGLDGQPCAVIGTAGKAIALTRFLSEELGFEIPLLVLTSKNPTWEEQVDTIQGLAQTVLVEPDRKEMADRICATDINLIFGSSFEKKIAHLKGIPLVRFSYPIIDNVSLTNSPYAGFRGIATWSEQIVNALFEYTSNKTRREVLV